MRTPVTEQIEGEAYTFGYLLTSEIIEIATEVAKLGLPAIAGAFTAVLDEDIDQAVNRLDLKGLAGALSLSLDPKTSSRLIQKLCSCVKGAGPLGDLSQSAIFEEHFRGLPGRALQVAVKSFEVNGGLNFFKSAVSLGGSLRQTASTQALPK